MNQSRLLLITPRFYDAEKQIISILQSWNYKVYWFENRLIPFDHHAVNAKFKILRKANHWVLKPDVRFVKKELKKIGDDYFDMGLVFNVLLD